MHLSYEALRRGVSSFLNEIYPYQCFLCKTPVLDEGICGDCWARLTLTQEPMCSACGYPLPYQGSGIHCFQCEKESPLFDGGYSLLHYTEASKPLILNLKHGDAPHIAPYLAKLMALNLNPAWKFEAIIPVPLHWKRRFLRGYNQAGLLAKGISVWTSRPHLSLLSRFRNTPPQGNLTPSLRKKNVDQAFEFKKVSHTPSSVLLVDDVYTTGATLKACARELKKNGIQNVYFATLGRVFKED